MPSYNSTARVPFKTGGSVKDKIKAGLEWHDKARDKSRKNVQKGLRTFNKALLGKKAYRYLYEGGAKSKGYKGKVHSTAEGRRAATKRTIKRGAKKALKIASSVNPLTAGYQLGKKFRGKKKIEHN